MMQAKPSTETDQHQWVRGSRLRESAPRFSAVLSFARTNNRGPATTTGVFFRYRFIGILHARYVVWVFVDSKICASGKRPGSSAIAWARCSNVRRFSAIESCQSR